MAIPNSTCPIVLTIHSSLRAGRRRRESANILLHELSEIIDGHLSRKASCIIKVDEYIKHIDHDLREDFGMTGAYVLGGRACAHV